jgi:hypothetical protein
MGSDKSGLGEGEDVNNLNRQGGPKGMFKLSTTGVVHMIECGLSMDGILAVKILKEMHEYG